MTLIWCCGCGGSVHFGGVGILMLVLIIVLFVSVVVLLIGRTMLLFRVKVSVDV